MLGESGLGLEDFGPEPDTQGLTYEKYCMQYAELKAQNKPGRVSFYKAKGLSGQKLNLAVYRSHHVKYMMVKPHPGKPARKHPDNIKDSRGGIDANKIEFKLRGYRPQSAGAVPMYVDMGDFWVLPGG